MNDPFFNEQERKLKETVFFIETTSCERQFLWEENQRCKGQDHHVDWKQDMMGFWQTIGHVNGRKHQPVCVSFSFALLNGKRVCFYEVTSRFSDSVMVEEFIEKRYPVKWDNGTRRAMTDAMNFHHVIDHIQTTTKAA